MYYVHSLEVDMYNTWAFFRGPLFYLHIFVHLPLWYVIHINDHHLRGKSQQVQGIQSSNLLTSFQGSRYRRCKERAWYWLFAHAFNYQHSGNTVFLQDIFRVPLAHQSQSTIVFQCCLLSSFVFRWLQLSIEYSYYNEQRLLPSGNFGLSLNQDCCK